MNTNYTVQRGDTLSKIAQAYGTTPNQLAELNQLHNVNRIHVGQRLSVPSEQEAPAMSRPEAAPSERSLFVQFVDALNAPIQGMKVMLTSAEEQIAHTTDALGKVPELTVRNAKSSVKVLVERLGGGWKSVAELTPLEESTFVRLRSPKVQIASSLLAHEGNSADRATKTTPMAPGTVNQTTSAGSHPVQSVALECPNGENLRLGPNFKYRDTILRASRRSGLNAQAVAAVMNAEAATIAVTHTIPVVDKKTGKPALDKSGKPKTKTWKENTGEWDPKSTAPTSSARGMTQFLDASWLEQAFLADTVLNNKAKSEGWLTTTTIKARVGKAVREKTVSAFRLANGEMVTKQPLARTLSSKLYLTGRATASDPNLQKLLDLRFEPEFAIQTAVDYGMQNLKALAAAGYKVATLNDGEKAKVLYLTHHLGLADAKLFIQDTMASDHARYLLKAQVGEATAKQKADLYNGDYLAAHRNWLKNFVDSRITLPPRMCDATSAPPVRDLISITESVRPAPAR